jgi:hypothetical protein
MFPNEIHNYTSKLNISKQLFNDAWSVMLMETRALAQEGKILSMQIVILGHNGQPLVIII